MDSNNTSGSNAERVEIPALDLPRLPHALTMWNRALIVGAVLLALFLLDRLTYVIMDYWLLDQQGYGEVFWTNFWTGLALFLFGFAAPFLAIALAVLGKDIDPIWRRFFIVAGLVCGMTGGYLLASRYAEFLLLFGAVPAGETDPVFGRDLGFFMFSLPAYWTLWQALMLPLLLGLVAQMVAVWVSSAQHDPQRDQMQGSITRFFANVSTLPVLGLVAAIGVLAAVGMLLARYNLLWKDNHDSAVYVGAEHIDVTGLFSNLNYYVFTAVLIAALTVGLVLLLSRVRLAKDRGDYNDAAFHSRRIAFLAIGVIAADFAFAGLVLIRDMTGITPNEPIVQLPYIKQHIDSTLRAYGLEKVEKVEFLPATDNDPLPSADALLQSATLKNAPLWPGWVSYLERVVDPQHADRILRTNGDPLVYGPLLDVFRAQQKLRSYYDFMDVDQVRYRIGGEKRLLVSSVRELPFVDPKPWIAWWGQRMLLFTHSHGLVTAPAGEIRGEGEPVYLTSGIPMRSEVPELRLDNPSVYYGEGADKVMGFTNARNIKEFHRPTDEGREETVYPPSIEAGIRVDSLFKRLIIGWRSGQPMQVWFSGMIADDTRLHFPRPPLDRMDRIAPFLFYDSNPFAVIHDGRVNWMVNGMTTSDRYPYSLFEELGDKSNEQSFQPRQDVRVNYVRDSVKAVIDAYTGNVSLYKFDDEPVVNSWANIYPSLFKPREQMPEGLRAHIQYPRQLMHIQFDDIYYKYHMTDPMTFFNLEDMWDDADEVKGPILADGKSITFSVEPRNWIAETGTGVLPAAREREQYVLSMVYTNEQALNLRAVPIVYQDGEDYGRIIVLQVPKGRFYLGTEQADAAIDQEPEISEQISWWNRTGSDVIRGHTSTLIVGNEVIYVEPLFIRSRQNPVSQMKRVIVVFRGFPAAGTTLEEALRAAIGKAEKAQTRTVAQAGN